MSQIPEPADPASIAAIHASLLRMRRYMSKPPGGAMELPGLAAPLDFAKVAACEAILELASPGLVSVGDIANELTLEHSSASRLLAECEDEGLIVRSRESSDGRRTTIALTQKGTQAAQTARLLHREFLKLLLDGWTEAEVCSFALMLDRFSDSLGSVLTAVTNGEHCALMDDTRARVERRMGIADITG